MDDRKYSRYTSILLVIAVSSAFLYSLGEALQPISIAMGIVAAIVSLYLYFSRHYKTATTGFDDLLISHQEAILDAKDLQLEILTYLQEAKGPKEGLFEELLSFAENEDVSLVKAVSRSRRIPKTHYIQLKRKKTFSFNSDTPWTECLGS
jgi:hypothetical protein